MRSDRRLPSRRLAAIVFTDIVNYSAVVHRDERLGERLLNRQKQVVRAVLKAYGGAEIKTAGDSFLIEFDSALAAVQAVIAIQQRLAAANAAAAADPPVNLRAAVHLGDVEHREADVYGDGVNIAARLLPLSPEGGLALSGAVLALVRQQLGLPLRSLGTPALKNIAHPVEVFVADAAALRGFELPSLVTAAADARPRQRGRRGWLIGAGLVLAIAAAAGLLALRGRAPASGVVAAAAPEARRAPLEQASIAVLPLVNQSGDPQYEYFSDGLTEELISALSKVPALRVVSRGSSFQFKNKPTDSRVVGEMLKVDNLLEGSVRKQGDRVRVIARLIAAEDGSQRWSQTFDREIKDIFALQSEIAEAVAGALQLKLLEGGALRASSNPNLDAYNAMLLANWYYERNDAANWRQAIDYYRQAVKIDPNYAMAWARLGLTWVHLAGNYLAGDEAKQAYTEARTTAERALQIDPNLADAHTALGWTLMIADLDVSGAERELKRAVQLAPTEADPRHRLAHVLGCLGRFDEAEMQIRQAFLLDPLGFRSWYYLSVLQTARGRYDDAAASVRKALELQPAAATNYAQLTVIDLMRGQPDAALLDALREPDDYWRDFAIAQARQALGDRAAADAALKEFSAHHSGDGGFQIATLYAQRREPELAFEWLDKALAARDPAITGLRLDPFFAAYRADPRYTAFCTRARLPLPT